MNRVLVVEDEEMIRKGIVLTVDWKALDCEVAGEAANGEEGLAAAERLKPDIIITDLKMPKMDGIAMLTELRKRGCTSKVIILTAYNSFSYARSALRLGAVDFLLKPYHDGELEEAILRLRELYPEDELFLITGADAFLTIQSWRSPEIIFKKAAVCTIPRNDDDFSKLSAHAEYLKTIGARTELLNVRVMTVSSTEIRERVRAGESIKGMVPERVEHYILSKGLYMSENEVDEG